MNRNQKLIGSVVFIIIILVCIVVGYISSNNKQISKAEAEKMFVDTENNDDLNKDDYEDEIVKESDNKESTSNNTSTNSDVDNKSKENIVQDDDKDFMYVEIKGAVKKPDVYSIKSGSIINDVITMAGGLTKEADIDKINRAEKLNENECIIIPRKGEKIDQLIINKDSSNSGSSNLSSGDTSNQSNKKDIININVADSDTLQELPGIGTVKADAIIQYREEKGGFKAIEDIKNVNGIGDSTYENIKNKIDVK